MSEDQEIKPCPFCGVIPQLQECYGTCYEFGCEECGLAWLEIQISDYMTIEERMGCSLTEENDHRYPQEYIDRIQKIAIERWNTRK